MEGGLYNVSISQELTCSCPNWNSYEPKALGHRFFPCKHLYWIYNVHLHCDNEYCTHQSTLVVIYQNTLIIIEVEKMLNRNPIPLK